MHKQTKNQRGIVHIVIILVLLILGIIGFVGWRIWNASSEGPKVSSVPSDSSSTEKTKATDEAPIKEPKRISTTNYSIALPSGWLSATCEDSNILFLAPTEDTLGRCNSEYFGAISISRNSGDVRAEGDPTSDPTAIDVSVVDTTIDGQPATKTGYTVGGEEFITPVGTRFVRYQTFYEGNTYTIGTSQAPGGASYMTELDETADSFRFSD